jgi:hypothetical protein
VPGRRTSRGSRRRRSGLPGDRARDSRDRDDTMAAGRLEGYVNADLSGSRRRGRRRSVCRFGAWAGAPQERDAPPVGDARVCPARRRRAGMPRPSETRLVRSTRLRSDQRARGRPKPAAAPTERCRRSPRRTQRCSNADGFARLTSHRRRTEPSALPGRRSRAYAEVGIAGHVRSAAYRGEGAGARGDGQTGGAARSGRCSALRPGALDAATFDGPTCTG